MQLFTNNGVSTLAGALASNATTLSLQAGTGSKFPSPSAGDFFLLTLLQLVGGVETNYEIVKVTARSVDTLTIVRAQESTTARAYAVGDQVSLRATAGTLAGLPQLASPVTFAQAVSFPTAAGGTSTTQGATTAFVGSAVATAVQYLLRFDVSTQGLTTAQKANAATNLGLTTVATTGSYADLSNKPAIPATTDALAEGATNLYFTAARAIGAVLTGLSTASSAVVAATDSVLAAIGKLQAQVSNKLALAGGTMAGAIAMGNNLINGLKTVGFNAEYDNGVSGAAITVTLANGQKQKVTLNTASTTITIASPGAANIGHYQLRIIQDATGSRVPTFSGISSSRWLGTATAPAVNSVANGESILNLYWDGTNFTQSLSKVGAA